MTAPSIVWFRNDLRLADNPALLAAAELGDPVILLFVLDDATEGHWRRGGASRWWLHHSLESLANSLRAKGAPLVFRSGDAAEAVDNLVQEAKPARLFWNRRYEPVAIEQDKAIKSRLKEAGIETRSFNAALVFEPWEIEQKSGEPYKVFTPYSRAWFDKGLPPEPLPPPKQLVGAHGVSSEELASWGLLPTKPDWAGGLRETWQPGEASAWKRAEAFFAGPIDRYGGTRNLPSQEGTSRLSPHLHAGEIGPRQLYHAAIKRKHGSLGRGGTREWLRQVCWRDFAYHTLYHRPEFTDWALREEFNDFPWTDDAGRFRAWSKGQTGYPIVDAGMRELWATGYLHNRARLIVGSFLTKDLLVPWQKGAHWFWDTLCDADLANNSMGWQWVAGCGIDAAPYFRIFNPVLQGEKFDPRGGYIRRWVPELARLPDKWVHKPFAASADVLEQAGVLLDETYPCPVVNHSRARDKALEAFNRLKRAA